MDDLESMIRQICDSPDQADQQVVVATYQTRLPGLIDQYLRPTMSKSGLEHVLRLIDFLLGNYPQLFLPNIGDRENPISATHLFGKIVHLHLKPGFQGMQPARATLDKILMMLGCGRIPEIREIFIHLRDLAATLAFLEIHPEKLQGDGVASIRCFGELCWARISNQDQTKLVHLLACEIVTSLIFDIPHQLTDLFAPIWRVASFPLLSHPMRMMPAWAPVLAALAKEHSDPPAAALPFLGQAISSCLTVFVAESSLDSLQECVASCLASITLHCQYLLSIAQFMIPSFPAWIKSISIANRIHYSLKRSIIVFVTKTVHHTILAVDSDEDSSVLSIFSKHFTQIWKSALEECKIERDASIAQLVVALCQTLLTFELATAEESVTASTDDKKDVRTMKDAQQHDDPTTRLASSSKRKPADVNAILRWIDPIAQQTVGPTCFRDQVKKDLDDTSTEIIFSLEQRELDKVIDALECQRRLISIQTPFTRRLVDALPSEGFLTGVWSKCFQALVESQNSHASGGGENQSELPLSIFLRMLDTCSLLLVSFQTIPQSITDSIMTLVALPWQLGGDLLRDSTFQTFTSSCFPLSACATLSAWLTQALTGQTTSVMTAIACESVWIASLLPAFTVSELPWSIIKRALGSANEKVETTGISALPTFLAAMRHSPGAYEAFSKIVPDVQAFADSLESIDFSDKSSSIKRVRAWEIANAACKLACFTGDSKSTADVLVNRQTIVSKFLKFDDAGQGHVDRSFAISQLDVIAESGMCSICMENPIEPSFFEASDDVSASSVVAVGFNHRPTLNSSAPGVSRRGVSTTTRTSFPTATQGCFANFDVSPDANRSPLASYLPKLILACQSCSPRPPEYESLGSQSQLASSGGAKMSPEAFMTAKQVLPIMKLLPLLDAQYFEQPSEVAQLARLIQNIGRVFCHFPEIHRLLLTDDRMTTATSEEDPCISEANPIIRCMNQMYSPYASVRVAVMDILHLLVQPDSSKSELNPLVKWVRDAVMMLETDAQGQSSQTQAGEAGLEAIIRCLGYFADEANETFFVSILQALLRAYCSKNMTVRELATNELVSIAAAANCVYVYDLIYRFKSSTGWFILGSLVNGTVSLVELEELFAIQALKSSRLDSSGSSRVVPFLRATLSDTLPLVFRETSKESLSFLAATLKLDLKAMFQEDKSRLALVFVEVFRKLEENETWDGLTWCCRQFGEASFGKLMTMSSTHEVLFQFASRCWKPATPRELEPPRDSSGALVCEDKFFRRMLRTKANDVSTSVPKLFADAFLGIVLELLETTQTSATAAANETPQSGVAFDRISHPIHTFIYLIASGFVTPQILSKHQVSVLTFLKIFERIKLPSLLAPYVCHAWKMFLHRLDDMALCAVLPQAAVCLIPYLDLSETQSQAIELYRFLIIEKRTALDDHFHEIHFLCDLPDISFPEDVRRSLSDAKEVDFKTQLGSLIRSISHESTNVKRLSLQSLFTFLGSHRAEIYDLILKNDTLDPLIPSLMEPLLAGLQHADSKIQVLSGKCLGELGAVDPGRLSFSNQRTDDTDGSGRSFQHLESDIVGGDLFEKILLPLLFNEQSQMHSLAAFAAQECLAAYGITREVSLRHEVNTVADRIWHTRMQDSSQEIFRPYLTSTYVVTLNTKLSDRPSPYFLAAVSFREWLRVWARSLTQTMSAEAPAHLATRIFNACQGVVEVNTTAALFLLPHMVINILLLENAYLTDKLTEEIKAILSVASQAEFASYRPVELAFSGTKESQSSRRSAVKHFLGLLPKNDVLLAVETIFSVYDTVVKWYRTKLRKTSQSKSSSRSEQSSGIVVHVQGFLAEFKKDILAKAAMSCKAYTRALLYWEEYLHEAHFEPQFNQKLTSDVLWAMQSIYDHLDEPDGLVGIAAVRKEESFGVEAQLAKIIDCKSAGRWNDVLACYELILQHEQRQLALTSFQTSKERSTTTTPALDGRDPKSAKSSRCPTPFESQPQAGVAIPAAFSSSFTSQNLVSTATSIATSSPDSDRLLGYHQGLLECFMKLGHFETVFVHTQGLIRSNAEWTERLSSYQVSAAWHMSRWDVLEGLIGNRRPTDFDGGIGRLFLDGCESVSIPTISEHVESCLSQLAAKLLTVSSRSGCYERSYDDLVQVHCLQEIDQVLRYLNSPEHSHDIVQMNGPRATALGSTIGVNVRPSDLILSAVHNHDQRTHDTLPPLHFWDNRLNLLQVSSRAREPVLSVRRALLSVMSKRLPDSRLVFIREECRMWLASALLAREAGNFQSAFSALLQAKQTIMPIADLTSKDFASLFLQVSREEAKINWSQGKCQEALMLLKRALDSNSTEQSTVTLEYARNLLLCSQWMIETARYESDVVLSHIKTVTENMETLLRDSDESKADELMQVKKLAEKAYFTLAKYMDDLSDFENEKKDSRSYAGFSLADVVRNYGQCLRFGSRYIFRALPRLLTLWFDAGTRMVELKSTTTKPGAKNLLTATKSTDSNLNEEMERIITSLPAYQLFTSLPQIVSRICHQHQSVAELIDKLLVRLISTYPQQTLWMLMATYKSTHQPRHRRCEEVFRKAEASISGIGTLIHKKFNVLTEDLLKLCNRPVPNDVTALNINECRLFPYVWFVQCSLADITQITNVHVVAQVVKRVHFLSLDFRTDSILFGAVSSICSALRLRGAFDIIVPVSSAMVAVLPGDTSSLNHSAFPSSLATIADFAEKVSILSSLQRPRKITVIGSDGNRYDFLCKPKDDLRKDARLMEFNSIVNKLLQRDPESRRRQLRIRTYAVVPLNEECGFLEWVSNTHGYRNIIYDLYKAKGLYVNGATIKNIMNQRLPGKVANAKREIFEKHLLPLFPPVFSEWFVNNFPDPVAWYASRQAYSRSCAVMSMVGFVVGLGDRHGENILFDSTTGECVHVDFNCLFNKGETFETPERVPFRLTHNMVEAFGATGVEGSFRRTCEVTLHLLRCERDALKTVLTTFIYDPLVEWSLNKGKARPTASGTTELNNEMAVATIKNIENRLKGLEKKNKGAPLSVEGHVDKLINEATSIDNLSLMYIGWAPYL